MIGINTKVWNFTEIHETAQIGDNCVIGSHCWIGPNVVIGNGVHIQSFCFIPEGVTIGNNVFIGPRVTFCNDKYPVSMPDDRGWKPEICIIGNDVVIGAGAIIFPVCLYNCCISAGAIIRKSIYGKNTEDFNTWYNDEDDQPIWILK